MVRLKERDVRKIHRLRTEGWSVRNIAREMDVSPQAVSYHLYPRYKESAMRRARATGRDWTLIYFKCPECNSGNIQMRLLKNRYECLDCKHMWKG